MAHTQGPWAITDDFIGVYDQQGRCVADMDSEGAPEIGYDESLANARLIAAAPDMLAALEDAVEALTEARYYPSELERFRAAIAKAKGN